MVRTYGLGESIPDVDVVGGAVAVSALLGE